MVIEATTVCACASGCSAAQSASVFSGLRMAHSFKFCQAVAAISVGTSTAICRARVVKKPAPRSRSFSRRETGMASVAISAVASAAP